MSNVLSIYNLRPEIVQEVSRITGKLLFVDECLSSISEVQDIQDIQEIREDSNKSTTFGKFKSFLGL